MDIDIAASEDIDVDALVDVGADVDAYEGVDTGAGVDVGADVDAYEGADTGAGADAYAGSDTSAGADVDAGASDKGLKLRFAHITVDDQQMFTEFFNSINPSVSDYTFSNLFIWRRMANYRYTWINGFLCIVALPYKYPPYAFAPAGDMSDKKGFISAVLALYNYSIDRGWTPRFRFVPKDAAQAIMEAIPNCKCVPDRDFFDYVYLAEDLINLKGKKYDGKRNHINKFKSTYEYEYERVTTDAQLEECFRIMRDRCVEKNCNCLKGMYYSCDRKPNMELLSNYDKLNCVGGIIKVNGRYEGFSIGAPLNSNTAVVFIEKANVSINGLYPFLNQQFCAHEWSGMTYINREEDEGVEGLRKAKLSYHPAMMMEKFTIALQQPLA